MKPTTAHEPLTNVTPIFHFAQSIEILLLSIMEESAMETQKCPIIFDKLKNVDLVNNC